MSRCFPFPPPGYEKKLRPEEDLLREEKRKEKKHKKEKKSKRKREGDNKEERRNKDRDKQKGKKAKKDKDRDKKENEETKSKDKDESSISEDATTAEQPEPSGRDNTRAREECSNAKSHGFSEKKFPTAFHGQNGWSLTDNRLVKENEESKFVQELGRRIKDEGKAIESRTVQRSASSDRKGYAEMHISAVADLQICNANGGTEFDPKKVEGKGLKDGHHLNGNNTAQNLTGSINRKVETPQNLTGSINRKVETPHEPVQRGIEKTVQVKDTSNGKSDDKQGKKRKDRDKKEKKSHGKDKERDKEKKKEKVEEKKKAEKEKETTEYKKRDQDRSKDLYRNEHASSSDKSINGYSFLVDNNFFPTENVKMKKDVEENGFFHVNEIGSSKLQTDQLMNNGEILDASRSPVLPDSNRLCIPLQDKVGVKYRELNGTVGPQSSYMPKQKPPLVPTPRSDQPIKVADKPILADKVVEASSRKLPQIPVVVEASREGHLAGKVIETSTRAPEASRNAEPSKKHSWADRMSEPSKKSPHPDLKYLTEVLSVPKMEEWSGIDDQDWLFNNKDLLLEKQKTDVSVDSRQLQVWSETLHIESADIYALPYVIPY